MRSRCCCCCNSDQYCSRATIDGNVDRCSLPQQPERLDGTSSAMSLLALSRKNTTHTPRRALAGYGFLESFCLTKIGIVTCAKLWCCRLRGLAGTRGRRPSSSLSYRPLVQRARAASTTFFLMAETKARTPESTRVNQGLQPSTEVVSLWLTCTLTISPLGPQFWHDLHSRIWTWRRALQLLVSP